MDFSGAVRQLLDGGDQVETAFFTVISSTLGPWSSERAAHALSKHFTVTHEDSGDDLMLIVRERMSGRILVRYASKDVIYWSGRSLSLLAELLAAFFGSQHPIKRPTFKIPDPGNATDQIGSAIPEHVVLTGEDQKILSEIDKGENVVLLGPSASGKTVIAALCARTLESRGGTCTYLDINASLDSFVKSVISLVKFCNEPNSQSSSPTVIFDNVQGSAPQFSRSFEIITDLLQDAELQPVFLFVGWPAIARLKHIQSENYPTLVLDARSQARAILKSSDFFFGDPAMLERGVDAVNGDCFMAYQLARHTKAKGVLPTFTELGVEILHATVGTDPISSKARSALYLLSALGTLEVFTTWEWIQQASGVSKRELNSMIGIRRFLDEISIGHRSKAFVLNRWLSTQDPSVVPKHGEIKDIIVRFCRSFGDVAITKAIERLDLSHPDSPTPATDNWDNLSIELWKAFLTLRSRILGLTSSDPAWGNNTASACFALPVLQNIDVGAWHACYDKIRDNWDYTDGQVVLRGEVAERDDFDAIKTRMEEEDAKNNIPDYWERSSEIDLDEFHRNWALGLLLLAEGSAQPRNPRNISTIENSILKSLGALGEVYPKRVPWVAARVLSGLASCGLNVHSSNVASRIADWILTEFPDGPFEEDHWKSGTGTWNTTYQTTAMAVSALVDAGISREDHRIVNATRFLDRNQTFWLVEGNEIPAIDVLILKIKMGFEWRSYISEIKFVLEWLLDTEQWALDRASVVATEEGVESSKLAQVASRAYDLVFEILKSDLETIVEVGTSGFAGLLSFLPPGDEEDGDESAKRVKSIIRYADFIIDRIDVEMRIRGDLLKDKKKTGEARERIKEKMQEYVECLERIRYLREKAITHPEMLDSEEVGIVQMVAQDIFWRGHFGGI